VNLEEPAPGAAVRLTAVHGFVNIVLLPQRGAATIGMIRAGQSVRLREPAPVRGPGVGPCAGGWYAVAPRGYVCAGADAVISAADDLVAAAAAEALPDPSGVLPFRVGVSTGTPLYLRVPTPDEQRSHEPDLDRHLASLPPPDDLGAVDARPAGQGPSPAIARLLGQKGRPLVAERDAYPGMKLAWAREFDAEGRTWLLTADLQLVPKDRVRVRATPELSIVDLRAEEGAALPLAFLWTGEAARIRRDEHGKFVETGETWARQAFVPVTGRTVRTRQGMLLQTRDGDYLRQERATVIRTRDRRPPGVGPKDKWVLVRVTHGYLVAYEGDKPVLASAMSPGADGVGRRGYTTPPGLYTVYAKAVSWDMAGVERGEPWKVDEVPWVAFFKDSYALHAAWWHDDFGRPRSHGCVNLPPAAAKALFGWLDPALPEGWYSVSAYYPQVKGTVIEVRP